MKSKLTYFELPTII